MRLPSGFFVIAYCCLRVCVWLFLRDCYCVVLCARPCLCVVLFGVVVSVDESVVLVVNVHSGC